MDSVIFQKKVIDFGKILLRIVSIIGIILTVLGMASCQKAPEKSKEDITERPILFSEMSFEKQKILVGSYLKDKYCMDCELSDITQKEIIISDKEKEIEYFCVATYDNFDFAVWITEDCNITTDAYTYFLKNSVNSYIQSLLMGKKIKCVAYDRFVLNEKTPFSWNNERVAEMLTCDTTYNNIHLYGVDKNCKKSTIRSALDGIKGTVYIHYNDFDMTNMNFNDYDDMIKLK